MHNQNKWGISGFLTGASHPAGKHQHPLLSCSRGGKRKCLNLGPPLLARQDMFPTLLEVFLDKFSAISAVKCLSDNHVFPKGREIKPLIIRWQSTQNTHDS